MSNKKKGGERGTIKSLVSAQDKTLWPNKFRSIRVTAKEVKDDVSFHSFGVWGLEIRDCRIVLFLLMCKETEAQKS